MTLETKEQKFYSIVIAPTLEIEISKATSLNSDRHLPALHGFTEIQILQQFFNFTMDKKGQVKDPKNQDAKETKSNLNYNAHQLLRKFSWAVIYQF